MVDAKQQRPHSLTNSRAWLSLAGSERSYNDGEEGENERSHLAASRREFNFDFRFGLCEFGRVSQQ